MPAQTTRLTVVPAATIRRRSPGLFLVPRQPVARPKPNARRRRLVDTILILLAAVLTLTPAIALYRQPAPSPRVYPPHRLAITAAVTPPRLLAQS